LKYAVISKTLPFIHSGDKKSATKYVINPKKIARPQQISLRSLPIFCANSSESANAISPETKNHKTNNNINIIVLLFFLSFNKKEDTIFCSH
jgi:hypothetical protein